MYEGKTTRFAHELLQRLLSNQEDDMFSCNPPSSSHPASIAPTPAPPKSELLAQKNACAIVIVNVD